MGRHLVKQWVFRITILLTLVACVTTVQAAKLDDVFNGEMLGVTRIHFESVAGTPTGNSENTFTFSIEGCQMQAFIEEEKVYALRLELTPRCQADLRSFGFNRSTHELRFGYFTSGKYPEAQHASDPLFYADCLKDCGNAFDPSVYALWEGKGAHSSFMEILLETSYSGFQERDEWSSYMEQQMGEDYVIDLRFNCENTFSNIAAKIFENVVVEAITIGNNLTTAAPLSALTSKYSCR